jgi:hypothetical protein
MPQQMSECHGLFGTLQPHPGHGLSAYVCPCAAIQLQLQLLSSAAFMVLCCLLK